MSVLGSEDMSSSYCQYKIPKIIDSIRLALYVDLAASAEHDSHRLELTFFRSIRF